MSTQHRPVMVDEVLTALHPRPGGRYIDGTVGGGGHTAALLRASAPTGRVLGLDRDDEALAGVRVALSEHSDRLTLAQGSFRQIAEIARGNGFEPCDGVVLDVGLSSDQLAAAERGFSFQLDGPLDMRFDRSSGRGAADLLNQLSEEELADIFYYFGEERRSRRLARVVVERRAERLFERTGDLVRAVEIALGPRRGRLHPATRIFQALRIAVNDELEALKAGLAGSLEVLGEGGRLAVISFHSLEDRLVKQFIRAHDSGGEEPPLRPLSRRPLQPGLAELAENPRSRSAKLRVAERLPLASAA